MRKNVQLPTVEAPISHHKKYDVLSNILYSVVLDEICMLTPQVSSRYLTLQIVRE